MKVLLIGDSPHLPTGFARVMREIANGLLNAGHEIKVIGWSYQNQEHKFPYEILSTIDPIDYYGQKVLPFVINAWQPDILFSLGDVHMVDWIADLPERKKVKWISYFPIDGSPLPNQWIPPIIDMDVPIVYSKFAYDLVKNAIPKDKRLELIPHGVDTEIFRPLPQEEIEEFKKQIFKNYDKNKNKYIVGCFARNQWRKNLPALFKAFAEFSKDKEDVMLYYHGAVKDVGWDIRQLVEVNNIQGKVVFLEGITPFKGVSDEILNCLYNMCDLMSVPTLGEGYGLPFIESQSTETPILVTDYTTSRELTQDECQLIKVACMYTPATATDKGVVIDYALVDHNDYVAKLNYFYNNRELGKQLGKQGREFALNNKWSDMISKFMDLFEGEINAK